MNAPCDPLPIYAQREALIAAVREHRVVVVEGPTGSGKTTQIPRLLRQAFAPCRIAVTQPRRIAAVSVAWRIAEQEGSAVGDMVGYAIRFDDQSHPDTAIKLMTDGILLSEARRDPALSSYDIIMVDEAHERSLNIDVTLGLLHGLLAERPDLRVVVSSATLRPEQFQEFFAPVVGDVPLVSVAARVYPIALNYQPPLSDHPLDLVDAAAQRVCEIVRQKEPGHVLVFLTGEDMIRRTDAAIHERCPGRDLVVLPLYARLTRQEQERVFVDTGERRKVILATNIAETSITIPDVRFVVDAGLAKVPRYSPRFGITTLREEPISQASAEQRAGRAGRTAPGVVYRLYPETSMAERSRLGDEEILRLDLAEVILRLLDLGFVAVEDFPFPTPPPRGKVKAALHQLTALGAIDAGRKLTPIGRRMAPFPLSPSLARMVIEAADRFVRVVDDVLIVGAFLSGTSPYVLPEGDVERARRAHRVFRHPLGDALTHLGIFRAWKKSRRRAAFCQRNYLDPEVLAFAQKAYLQLREIAEGQGIEVRGGGPASEVVRCLAAGFADKMIRRRRGGGYEAVTGARVVLHPSSVFAGQGPDLAVAAELVRHKRAYAINISELTRDWMREVSPEAAEYFGLGRGRTRPAPAPPPVTEVTIGELILPVKAGRGKPTVDLSLEHMQTLAVSRADTLAAEARAVRGRVVWTERSSFPPVPLGKLLVWAKNAPYPTPGTLPSKGLTWNDLMEIDRDRHALGRSLQRLLEPASIGRSAGWVSLVANGAGGFWLDVVTHYPDALTTSLVSLASLINDLYDGDELLARAQAAHQDLTAKQTALEQATG